MAIPIETPTERIRARKRVLHAATEIAALRDPQFLRPRCRRVLMEIPEVADVPLAIQAAAALLVDADEGEKT